MSYVKLYISALQTISPWVSFMAYDNSYDKHSKGDLITSYKLLVALLN